MELYADESQKKESVANALTGANNDIELFFLINGSDVFRQFGRLIYWFGHPNSGAQKTLLKFSFFSCISTENTLK